MKATRIGSLLTLFLYHFLQVAVGIFREPEWDTVRVTYKPLDLWWGFKEMPLTRNDTESYGFSQLGGSKSAPCSGKFHGYRYIRDDDPAVILLYDVKGYIAGIQTSFPEDSINKDFLGWYQSHRLFTVEELPLKANNTKSYTLTTYFVDPSIICTTGRNESQFNSEPGGIDLYYMNGTETIHVPKHEDDLTGTSWTKGRCVASMGVHYWYNITGDMNCDYFQPIFLLFNHGKLTGFGWATFLNFPSLRYEHPPSFSFPLFMKEVPTCLTHNAATYGVTTLHTYLNFKLLDVICL